MRSNFIRPNQLSDGAKVTREGEITKASENLAAPEIKRRRIEMVFFGETMVEGINKMVERHDVSP